MAEFSSLSSQSFEEETQDLNAVHQQPDTQPPPPTSQPPPPSGAGRRRRGRPLGSKNKPKTRPTEPAIRSMQLLIPAGFNILDLVQNFARKHRVGVRILNGSGKITHITLLHPPVTLTNVFDLITMGGTFVDSSLYSSFAGGGASAFLPDGRLRWLSALVNGSAAGELYGGVVDSGVVAATNVVLNVLTFKIGGFHRLDHGERRPDGGALSDAPGGGGDGGGLGGGVVPNLEVGYGGVPAVHRFWAPPGGDGRPLNRRYSC